jgi:ATP:corrinoid adenosyltransferase
LLTEGDAETSWFDDSGVKVGCVQYKKGVWYFHESRVFHQVAGMTHYRLAVTVFVPEPQTHQKTVMV